MPEVSLLRRITAMNDILVIKTSLLLSYLKNPEVLRGGARSERANTLPAPELYSAYITLHNTCQIFFIGTLSSRDR
jgi:hypothetical protein